MIWVRYMLGLFGGTGVLIGIISHSEITLLGAIAVFLVTIWWRLEAQ
jgi:hypothetical protein